MTLPPDDLDHLADEYVLGLLSETEARLFEELVARDVGLARRVGTLRDHILPLDLSAPPAALPDGFYERLTSRIASEASQPRRQHGPVASRPFLQVARLLAASFAGVLVGMGLAGILGGKEPIVFAVLVDPQGVPQAVIEDYGDDTAEVRFLVEPQVPPDRTLQVWTLPSALTGPTSLGVLSATGRERLVGPDLPAPQPAQLYEITLEPRGGSPSGRPTGPIVGKGLAVPNG